MKTKLAVYLEKHRLSHRAFAEKAGIPHLHPMISLWARAQRWPGGWSALAIEKATDGAVPASYWQTLKRKQEANRSH